MTSVVPWLPVNAAWVYGRGCFYVVLHNTEISTQHGIWGRKGDKIERGRLKIQILSDGIFPRGHESHLQWCRWERSYDKQHFIHQWQLLCFPEKNSAFCWSLSKTEGERREEKNNNNQLSFWFTYFFLGGGSGKETLFQSRFKKEGVFQVTDANIHHHCLFSFGKVRGQLPVVDREKASEQNTFIVKYYLAKIFTRV